LEVALNVELETDLKTSDLDKRRKVFSTLAVYGHLREILSTNFHVDSERRRLEGSDGKEFYVLWLMGVKGQRWILVKNTQEKVRVRDIPQDFLNLGGPKTLISASTLRRDAFELLNRHGVEIIIVNWKFYLEAWPRADGKAQVRALRENFASWLRDSGSLPNALTRDIEICPLDGSIFCKRNGQSYDEVPRLAQAPRITYSPSFLRRQLYRAWLGKRSRRRRLSVDLGVRYSEACKRDLDLKRSLKPQGETVYSGLMGPDVIEFSSSDFNDAPSDPPF